MISLETINERFLLLSALDVWGGSGTGHLLLVLESHVWLMALCWPADLGQGELTPSSQLSKSRWNPACWSVMSWP